ncbi:TPA: ATP-binding protein [Candidatus Woesearchaeota archaeon]|nr:ATP-binding protein [Candidatus Woesearchaeota archaeon]
MLYTRTLFFKLESEIETKEVTVITGMRRVGKTTALLHLYDLVQSKNKAVFDLENPLHRKVFEEENYDAVWSNLQQFGITNTEKAYLFLDEVQNLPEVSRVVKYLYDHWNVKFFLTGSSSYYLRNLFPESLAGRKIIFEMFPLTFAEFLIFKHVQRNAPATFAQKAKDKNKISYDLLNPYYREYLEFGGFPPVVLEQNPERKKILLSEIFTSYFEKDAKNLADFKDMSKLRDLILLLIPRIGSRIEVLKLATGLSISRETVYTYLAFLEQTYFISLLPRHSGSVDRQAAGSRKLFICDCGIANILGKPAEGQLLEQSIFQNLRSDHKLSFYNKDGGTEIDFIADGKVALEVKMTASQRDITTLRLRAESIHLTERYVITSRYSEKEEIIVATDM